MEKKQNGWSKHIGLRFQIGLIVSLSLTLAAFEWKNYHPNELVILGTLDDTPEDLILPPITEVKPPPPPKPKVQPEIIAVEEDVPEEDLIEFSEYNEEINIDEPEVTEEPPAEEVAEEPDFFLVPEVAATPKEGMNEFLKFVAENMKYPVAARRMGVEGKVFVQFIIEKDGSLSDLQVVRGIGAGCDEEAVSVLKKSKKWNPARQRGKAVRQRMVLPIYFRLN